MAPESTGANLKKDYASKVVILEALEGFILDLPVVSSKKAAEL